MIPTVAEVLELEPVRRGRPRVVAGAQALGNLVRWVHISELVEVAHLLRGGELLLTTGIALPDDPDRLSAYVRDVARAGASGLIVELGQRFMSDLPVQMARAADEFGLPLLVFDRQVQFVRVTEVVHARIVADQMQELRTAERLDNTFNGFLLQGKSVTEVVTESGRLTGLPVVLEDLSHRVLACEPAGRDVGELLRGWAQRSRDTRLDGRTGYDPDTGLVVAMVGTPKRDWGRLFLATDRDPTAAQTKLVQRASNTVALCRLTEPGNDLYKEAQHDILTKLLGGEYTPGDLAARAAALGVPLDRRLLVGLAARPSEDQPTRSRPDLDRLEEALAQAAREASVPALVTHLDAEVVAVLGFARSSRVEPVLADLAAAVRAHARVAVSIGVGPVVDSVAGASRSLTEARDAAATTAPSRAAKPYHDLNDLGIRGVLYLLQGDVRLQAFLERQLGPLLTYDTSHPDESLVPVLSALVAARGNRTATAKRLKLSRPTVYERLHHIERILEVNLSDPEHLTAIHVALLAHQDL